MKKPTKSGMSRSSNRWRLQDAKARLSEVVRQAQQRGPQRVTLHGRDAVVVVRADEFDRIQRPVSGRDIVAALAASPLADVSMERLTFKSPIRDAGLWGGLLDTNVVSELGKPKPNSAVSEFVAAQPGEVLFTTEETFGEIRFGIEQLEDAGRRTDIHMWLNRTLRPLFFGRVLAITEDVIVRWKTMAVEGQKRRHIFGQPDLFIAAIAALEDLVVVTRDTSEFVVAEVPVFDPWSSILHVHGKEVRIEPPASVHAVNGLVLKRGL